MENLGVRVSQGEGVIYIPRVGENMQGCVSYKKDPDRWVFVCVCVCLCARVCVRGSECMWRREATNDVNLVQGRGNGVTCVSKRDKGMSLQKNTLA